MKQPFFITFEGGEAVGKSTQMRLLTQALEKRNYHVVATREPGGTPKGEEIRKQLLDPKNHFSLVKEIEAHFSARYDHVQKIIDPALRDGKVVLCDRFVDSTMAYQGIVQGKKNPFYVGLIKKLALMLPIYPSLTFLLHAQWSSVCQRLKQRHHETDIDVVNRYEQNYEHKYQLISDAFFDIASENENRIVTIDNSYENIEEVHENILKRVLVLLEGKVS